VTGPDPVDVLRRWEQSGAIWTVVSQTGGRLEIALLTCTGAEQVDRLVSDAPELAAYIGGRLSSGD
jgi:hypothetical protein